MKKLFRFRSLALFVLTAFFLTSCSNDDDGTVVVPQQSIVDITVSNPDFSILVQALTKANLVTTLDGDGPFTVFAPTNSAFTAFLSANGFASLDAVPADVLKQVLLNHVVSGENLSTDLSTGYVTTLGKGSASTSNNLSMFVNTTNGVVLNGGTTNGGATVTTADIEASNGVIHVVNGVIGLPTIVNHAIANPSFEILVQALTRNDQPDFAGILSGTASSPFTVFAPTDEAFVDLLAELELSSLANVPQAVLENTLKYHVVAGANILSSSLTNNQSVTTFQGGTFTVELPSSGPQIRDANNRVSLIIATDVQASNGVIHALDKVILPNL
ncbi:fasciclin domain-containing protein [Flavobacterium sp. PLA-1-15]|uniref:fasciclin domain-containing protein n=1 Tax=Flavobacterium sp. PLA-1-15 TaxID=3380533 RepID=UPI003B7FE03F